MTKYSFYILFLLIFPLIGSTNTTIDVCIAHGQRITELELKIQEHSYDLTKNGQTWLTLSKGQIVHIQTSGNGFKVLYQGITHDVTGKIELKRKAWSAAVKVLKSDVSGLKNRIYQDNLRFENKGGSMRVTNSVYIENYVSGVVEAESGAQQNVEYYKVQAVICRTYAWRICAGTNLKGLICATRYTVRFIAGNHDIVKRF
jgi:peptidoglycan hydrolase-like amidase